MLTGVVAIVGALISAADLVRDPGRRHADHPRQRPRRSTLIAINAGFVLLLIGADRPRGPPHLDGAGGAARRRRACMCASSPCSRWSRPSRRIMVAVVASITLDIGLDRWFEIRTKTIISSSLSIADAYVQENARNLQGTTLSMANDLDQARSLYSLDRTGFRELMSQQALGRNLAHAALISEDGSFIMAAKTSADFDMPQAPPEWVASAASGQPVLIEPQPAQPRRRDRQDARDRGRLSLHDQAGRPRSDQGAPDRHRQHRRVSRPRGEPHARRRSPSRCSISA